MSVFKKPLALLCAFLLLFETLGLPVTTSYSDVLVADASENVDTGGPPVNPVGLLNESLLTDQPAPVAPLESAVPVDSVDSPNASATSDQLVPSDLAKSADSADSAAPADSADSADPLDPLIEPPPSQAIIYRIVIDTSIRNGTVAADTNEAAPGDHVALTVAADVGYELSPGSLTVTISNEDELASIPVMALAGNPDAYSFAMPDSDVAVAAEFVASATSGLQGLGTRESPYRIDNRADLLEMNRLFADVALAPGYRDAHYILTVDIDLVDIEWLPLEGQFTGSFDGQGHTIANMHSERGGFFTTIDSSGAVRNLILETCTIGGTATSASYIGGIAGNMWGNPGVRPGIPTIENCHVTGSIIAASASGTTNVGGIIGNMYGGHILNCTVKATVALNRSGSVGGIAGNVGGYSGNEANAVFLNCSFDGTITGTSGSIGGIVGLGEAMNTIRDCTVTGVISNVPQDVAGNHLGGIVGMMTGGKIEHCQVHNTDINANSLYVGGIVGRTGIQYSTVTGVVSVLDCLAQDIAIINTNASTALGGTGGIVGDLAGSGATIATVSGCCFIGMIQGTGTNTNANNGIGGIAGRMSIAATVVDCYSAGQIKGDRGGGIAYIAGSTTTIANSYSTIRLDVANSVAGLVAIANGTTTLQDDLALNPSIVASDQSAVVHAITTSANYAASSRNITAWSGMMLDYAPLSELDADAIRNGTLVTTEALMGAGAWPAAMSGNAEESRWRYTEGKMPILKAFADLTDDSLPAYMTNPFKAHTITFDFDDGITPLLEVRVLTNDTACKPMDPFIRFKVFLGWFAEGAEEPFDFSLPIVGDIRLTAGWEDALDKDTLIISMPSGAAGSIVAAFTDSEGAIVPIQSGRTPIPPDTDITLTIMPATSPSPGYILKPGSLAINGAIVPFSGIERDKTQKYSAYRFTIHEDTEVSATFLPGPLFRDTANGNMNRTAVWMAIGNQPQSTAVMGTLRPAREEIVTFWVQMSPAADRGAVYGYRGVFNYGEANFDIIEDSLDIEDNEGNTIAANRRMSIDTRTTPGRIILSIDNLYDDTGFPVPLVDAGETIWVKWKVRLKPNAGQGGLSTTINDAARSNFYIIDPVFTLADLLDSDGHYDTAMITAALSGNNTSQAIHNELSAMGSTSLIPTDTASGDVTFDMAVNGSPFTNETTVVSAGFGDIVTVRVNMYPLTSMVYGFTGGFLYNPSLLEYVPDSAAFDMASTPIHSLTATNNIMNEASATLRISAGTRITDSAGNPVPLADGDGAISVTMKFKVSDADRFVEWRSVSTANVASVNALALFADPSMTLESLQTNGEMDRDKMQAARSESRTLNLPVKAASVSMRDFTHTLLAYDLSVRDEEPVSSSLLTTIVNLDDTVTVQAKITAVGEPAYGFTGTFAYNNRNLALVSATLDGDSADAPLRLAYSETASGETTDIRLNVENDGELFLPAGETAVFTMRFKAITQSVKYFTITPGAYNTVGRLTTILDKDLMLAHLMNGAGTGYDNSKLDAATEGRRITESRRTLPNAVFSSPQYAFSEYRWDMRNESGNADRLMPDRIEVSRGEEVTVNLHVTPHNTSAYGFTTQFAIPSTTTAAAGLLVPDSMSVSLLGRDTGHRLQHSSLSSTTTLRVWIDNDVTDASGKPIPLAEPGETFTISIKFRLREADDTTSTERMTTISLAANTAVGRLALFTDPSLKYADLCMPGSTTVYLLNLMTVANERRILDHDTAIHDDAYGLARYFAIRPNASVIIREANMGAYAGADTRWYDENPNAAEYSIGTPEELLGLAYLVNRNSTTDTMNSTGVSYISFRYQTIKLTADIDLSKMRNETQTFGQEWVPIGWGLHWYALTFSNNNLFRGAFDGQGHTISGLADRPLFGEITGATLKDFHTSGTVRSQNISGRTGAGVVATANNSRLEHLSSDVTLIGDNNAPVGGIVNSAVGGTMIVGCEFRGTFSFSGQSNNTVGGIIAAVSPTSFLGAYTVLIEDCANYASVASAQNAGGIVGEATQYTVAGILDTDSRLVIRNCVNYGDLTEIRGNAGGIISSFGSVMTIEGCANYGAISSVGSNAGGIFGFARQGQYLTLRDSYNRRNVASLGEGANGSAGGLAGRINGSDVKIVNTYNTGSIAAVSDMVRQSRTGGIVGYADGTLMGGNNFFLDAASTNAVAGATSSVALSRTAAQMKETGFAQTLGNVYCAVTNDYPVLYYLADDYVPATKGAYVPPALNDSGFYELATSEDVVWFANQVNVYGRTNINAILTGDDYSLTSPEFAGIGGAFGSTSYLVTIAYGGIFDGNGKTVSLNLSCSEGFAGMFGVTYGATIKNLTIEGSVTSYNGAIGGVVGFASNTTLQNVVNNANVARVQGVVGGSQADNVGGLIGHVDGGNTIINSFNNGEVSIYLFNGTSTGERLEIKRTGDDGAFGVNYWQPVDRWMVPHAGSNVGGDMVTKDADPDDKYKVAKIDGKYEIYNAETKEIVDGKLVDKGKPPVVEPPVVVPPVIVPPGTTEPGDGGDETEPPVNPPGGNEGANQTGIAPPQLGQTCVNGPQPPPNETTPQSIESPTISNTNEPPPIYRPVSAVQPPILVAEVPLTGNLTVEENAEEDTEDTEEEIPAEPPPLAAQIAPVLDNLAPAEVARETGQGMSATAMALSAIVILALATGGVLLYRKKYAGSKAE